MEDARRVLKAVFGYDAFRPGQEQAVRALLEGRDLIAVMPTGAGKSVCYQIPALMRDGITLVISPLISLMRDQVWQLGQAGVRAAYINSTLTPRQQQKAIDYAREGRYRIIYAAPERLIYAETNSYIPVSAMLYNLPYYPGEYLITPVFGQLAGHLYQMLGYFCITNLVLCVFNLLPVPPLDGYHVLNDLVLRRRQLFANPQTARIASSLLFVAALTGYLGRAIGWVDTQVLAGAGKLAAAVLRATGLM